MALLSGILFFFLSGCFLFDGLRKERVQFSGKEYQLVLPKGYKKQEKKTTNGNEEVFFFYPNGTYLYFVHTADTSLVYQPIDFSVNQPKELYGALFYKGIDSNYSHYWRENRKGSFRAGYYNAPAEDVWRFDSSLNGFSKLVEVKIKN